MKDAFLLNKKVRFFNNGSYGACPAEVFSEYQKWQRIIEDQPVDFFQKTLIPELQKLVKPLITGWGWGNNREIRSENSYLDANQFYGTEDLSSYLAIPVALEFYGSNNIAENNKLCNDLVKYFLSEITDMTGLDPLYRIHPDHLMMGIVELPGRYNRLKLKEILYDKFKIEVPVLESKGKLLIRISVQIYNRKEDIDYFLEVLKKLYDQ